MDNKHIVEVLKHIKSYLAKPVAFNTEELGLVGERTISAQLNVVIYLQLKILEKLDEDRDIQKIIANFDSILSKSIAAFRLPESSSS